MANPRYATQIRPLYSTLDPDHLIDVLTDRFDFPKSSRCQYFFKGSNDIYKLFQTMEKYLLEGYESILPLNDAEKEALPDFYLMRRIWINRVCCDQFTNWGSSFLSVSRWKREIQKPKTWESSFSKENRPTRH